MQGYMQELSKKIVGRSALLIGFCLLIALTFNQLSPRGLHLITTYYAVKSEGRLLKVPIFTPRAHRQTPPELNNLNPVTEVSLEEVRRLHAEGLALFIDTRPRAEYLRGHIARAISLPLEDFEQAVEALAQIPPERRIVTYCDGSECSQSVELAVKLSERGFLDIAFFPGGWQAWAEAGLPVLTGALP